MKCRYAALARRWWIVLEPFYFHAVISIQFLWFRKFVGHVEVVKIEEYICINVAKVFDLTANLLQFWG